ncbi:MAG: hypothetical protein OXN25_22315 [Candidatus Poribacteria bacterium]|nr:hypothetical protein [Candidatus Poribacteria bacterium]
MKSTLVASIPALVVLFALVFGFGTFHVVVQNAEASDSDDCKQLADDCSDAQESASTACASGNVERCENAQAEAMQTCSDYRSKCL